MQPKAKISGAILILASVLALLNCAFANGTLTLAIPTFGPPTVQTPQENVSATISQVNGALWAQVDASYSMSTVHKYGDVYECGNGSRAVLYNQLDAYYPVPPNTSDIGLKMDDKDLNWRQSDNTAPAQLYGQSLSEVQWSIAPVPANFQIIAHYEHPVSAENGNYIFLYSFGSRFTLDKIGAESNNWYNGSTAFFDICVMLNYIGNINAYSIDNGGKLTPANWTVTKENSANIIHVIVADGTPSGAVVLFNQEPEPTPSASPTPSISPQATASIQPIVSVIPAAENATTAENSNSVIYVVIACVAIGLVAVALVLKKRHR